MSTWTNPLKSAAQWPAVDQRRIMLPLIAKCCQGIMLSSGLITRRASFISKTLKVVTVPL